jgi:hypothetical protein
MSSKISRILLVGAFALTFGGATALGQETGEAKKEKTPSKADLAKYDANKDGQLDDAEAAALKADRDAKREANKKERLEKYDANRDGKVDQAEREAEAADKEKAKAEKQAAKEAKKAEREARKAEKQN